jgi:hypothetical protein
LHTFIERSWTLFRRFWKHVDHQWTSCWSCCVRCETLRSRSSSTRHLCESFIVYRVDWSIYWRFELKVGEKLFWVLKIFHVGTTRFVVNEFLSL